MTPEDKDLLLHFVTRTSMFIEPVTAESAINFINGYEAGRKEACDLTKQLRQVLSTNYKTAYSSDGWPGQLKRLAKKRSASWLVLFRRLTLDLLVAGEVGNLTEPQQAELKRRIVRLIEQWDAAPRDLWVTGEWLSLCAVKRPWFKQLWTREEWLIIQKVEKQVQAQAQAPVAHNQRLDIPLIERNLHT